MAVIEKYVPVLRWKQAEREGLGKLAPAIRERITPLFEFIMPSPKRDKDDYKTILADSKTVLEERLKKVLEDINKCCFQGSAFIDVHLIDGDVRPQTLKKILEAAEQASPTLIPVTHIIPVLSTEADMETRNIAVDYAHKSAEGLCIRIDRFNLGDEDLAEVINNFIVENNLDIKQTDLLVDLGVIDPLDDAKTIETQLAKLPHLGEWRSFIVSGGAFPKDLSDIEKFSQQQVPRLDWKIWKELNAGKNLPRKPIYSDYTVQHPIYFGNMDVVMNTSASMRYTDLDLWEISRGEGLRNKKGQGFKQYPAMAQLLIGQPFYKGKDYSFGDTYLTEIAENRKNTGNPTTWLKAGINHHLTLVVQERAKLL